MQVTQTTTTTTTLVQTQEAQLAQANAEKQALEEKLSVLTDLFQDTVGDNSVMEKGILEGHKLRAELKKSLETDSKVKDQRIAQLEKDNARLTSQLKQKDVQNTAKQKEKDALIERLTKKNAEYEKKEAAYKKCIRAVKTVVASKLITSYVSENRPDFSSGPLTPTTKARYIDKFNTFSVSADILVLASTNLDKELNRL